LAYEEPEPIPAEEIEVIEEENVSPEKEGQTSGTASSNSEVKDTEESEEGEQGSLF